MNKLRVVIIEDESLAAERLENLLLSYSNGIEIVKIIDSVERSIDYFKHPHQFDLIFMDIQLGDGLSLDIYNAVEITKPVIFVTAYDSYALKAFKVNSIDYLLKPIVKEDLIRAMDQFNNLKKHFVDQENVLLDLYDSLNKKNTKDRFLIKKGKGLRIVTLDQVAYFYSEGGYLYIMDRKGARHILENTLENLLESLDRKIFFRINRKMIVRVSAITEIRYHSNSRLLLDMFPKAPHEVIISRERCKEFKEWLA